MTKDCNTCIHEEGSCYPSTTIFDKDKTCKSYDPDYEGYIDDLENKNRLLGERCNQLLKDKGELTDKIAELNMKIDGLEEQTSYMFDTIALQEQQIEKMKCCENCKHKKSEVDRCELLMYTMNACLCKNKDKWELKND